MVAKDASATIAASPSASRRGAAGFTGTASSLLAPELREPLVQHRILLPRVEVEVPPLVLVDREAFGLHGVAQRVAQPALLARAAGVPGVGAVAELVVAR